MPYKNDLEAAHGRIAALEQQINPPEEKVKCDKCGDWDKKELGFAGIVFFYMCLLIGSCMTLSITHGDLGDCYIEADYNKDDNGDYTLFELHQEVNWGSDNRIGVFKTLEEAQKGAALIDCPLGHSK